MSKGASMRRGVSAPQRFVMFWVRHLQQGTASLGELWRTPAGSLLTIAVIGLCLALPSIFHLAIKNIERALPQWQDNAQISLFLQQELSDDARGTLMASIEAMPNVARVTLIDKAQGLAEFKTYSGFGDTLDMLGDNPLPDVLLVMPRMQEASLTKARTLQKQLSELDGVEQAKLDIEWLERLEGMLHVVERSMQLLIVLLLCSVLLMIGNTIRLNILNQRDEIEVMKLVGATNAFIQRPFLYTGFWFGFIGGLMAWLLTNIALLWSENALVDLVEVTGSNYHLAGLSPQEFGALMMVSSGLGVLASGVSVWRHIRQIEPSG
jgi:cell division transport system permease protein